MTLKRTLAAALAALMCLSLCACGKAPGAASSSGGASASASASVSAPAPEAAALPLTGPMQFSFCSGAGGWSTDMELAPDGTFVGQFHDSDMGDSGVKYPDGTLYYCNFSGRFGDVVPVDEHTWSMVLTELTVEDEPEKTTYEDGVRYISSEPYGLSGVGSAYRLYLPDTPLDGLSEEFLTWWPLRYDQDEVGRKTLTCWGILNETEEYGFFSFDEDFYFEVPVPADIAPLVTVNYGPTQDDGPHRSTLVTVSETASLEAGQKQHPGEDWGDGWLFSVARLDRVGLEQYLAYDDSNFDFFAARADGSAYYIFEYPTDVRLNRLTPEEFNAAMSQWGDLCQWADDAPAAVLEANPELLPFSARDVLGDGYLYEGEHPVAFYEDPDDALGGNALIVLSQPMGAGKGRIWCVERVQYLFAAGEEPYILPVFPVSMGHEVPAEEYYAQLQAECDAGQHPELLTPEGALEEFVRTSDSWMYDPDRSMALIKFVEPVG